jgi:hypothetical protein
MSEFQVDTGGEAEHATSIADASSPTSQPGFIHGAGRLTIQQIALLAAEQSGATGVGTDGIAVWEID